MPNNQMVEALPFNIIHSFIHSFIIDREPVTRQVPYLALWGMNA